MIQRGRPSLSPSSLARAEVPHSVNASPGTAIEWRSSSASALSKIGRSSRARVNSASRPVERRHSGPQTRFMSSSR